MILKSPSTPPKLYDNYESATSVAVGTGGLGSGVWGVARVCATFYYSKIIKRLCHTVLKSKMERQACKAREEEEIHTSHEEPK
jgi:hypothetical protein